MVQGLQNLYLSDCSDGKSLLLVVHPDFLQRDDLTGQVAPSHVYLITCVLGKNSTMNSSICGKHEPDHRCPLLSAQVSRSGPPPSARSPCAYFALLPARFTNHASILSRGRVESPGGPHSDTPVIRKQLRPNNFRDIIRKTITLSKLSKLFRARRGSAVSFTTPTPKEFTTSCCCHLLHPTSRRGTCDGWMLKL